MEYQAIFQAKTIQLNLILDSSGKKKKKKKKKKSKSKEKKSKAIPEEVKSVQDEGDKNEGQVVAASDKADDGKAKVAEDELSRQKQERRERAWLLEDEKRERERQKEGQDEEENMSGECLLADSIHLSPIAFLARPACSVKGKNVLLPNKH